MEYCLYPGSKCSNKTPHSPELKFKLYHANNLFSSKNNIKKSFKEAKILTKYRKSVVLLSVLELYTVCFLKEGTGVNIKALLSKFRVDSYSFQQDGHFAV